jgi:hypothetical protein
MGLNIRHFMTMDRLACFAGTIVSGEALNTARAIIYSMKNATVIHAGVARMRLFHFPFDSGLPVFPNQGAVQRRFDLLIIGGMCFAAIFHRNRVI